MSMGLANSSATFNRVLEQIMTGIPPEVCVVYIDDLLVHAVDCDQMFDRLSMVLEHIKVAGLKFKPVKCELFKKEVLFLGHRVAADGIRPDRGKTQVVMEWDRPTCAKEVRSFLGLCGYYRRFVDKFADAARPLYKLTEKEAGFSWSDEAEDAFNLLKSRLCQAPVLGYPDISKPFILDCDASNEGLGAVLSQMDGEGTEHPVAYHAKAFSKVEKRYCVTRRELLACVNSIRHFHHYLLGAKFIVRTDHNSLVWLCHFRDLDGQLARWLENLAQYDFEIIHRKGRLHGNADGLSRRPCAEAGCTHCDKAELMEYSVNFVEAAVSWIPYKELSGEGYDEMDQDRRPGREADVGSTMSTACVDVEHGMQSEGGKRNDGGGSRTGQPVETEIQGSIKLGDERRVKGETQGGKGVDVVGVLAPDGVDVRLEAHASLSQRSIGHREGVRRVCPVRGSARNYDITHHQLMSMSS